MSNTPAPSSTPSEGPVRREGFVGRALRVPLLYKILLANVAIVVVGATTGTYLTAHLVRARPGHSTVELVGGLVLAGVVVSVAVNWLILRVALSPLREVEETARRVEAGDPGARAPESPLADRDLDRLVRVLNAMLDRVEEHQTRLRRVARGALAATEEERRRIAAELHDDTAQRLAFLLVQLRVARDAGDPDVLRERIDDWREELVATLESIRAYARGLRPPALDELGVVAAVRGLARKASETGLEVEVLVEDEVEGLGPDAELAFYRMVQEAVSNAVRHSGAGRIELRLGVEREHAVAVVQDDGAGFDPGAVEAEGTGLGLVGMRERALYVDGTVRIESAPGEGTTVEIRLPIRRAPPSR